MRSVLVILAAIVVTVVAGGPAQRSTFASRQTIDRGFSAADRCRAGSGRDAGHQGLRGPDGGKPCHRLRRRRRRDTRRPRPKPAQKYDARSSQAQMYAEHLARSRTPLLARSAPSTQDLQLPPRDQRFCGASVRRTGREAPQGQGGHEVWEDRRMPLDTNNSPTFLGLLDEPKMGCARSMDLRGKGVIVGIIDSGAVQEHPSFDDEGFEPAGELERHLPGGRGLGRRRLQQQADRRALLRGRLPGRRPNEPRRFPLAARFRWSRHAHRDHRRGTRSASDARRHAGRRHQRHGAATRTSRSIRPASRTWAVPGRQLLLLGQCRGDRSGGRGRRGRAQLFGRHGRRIQRSAGHRVPECRC